MKGNIESLIEYSQMLGDFPFGRDGLVDRHWITNAVDCGPYEVIEWMLKAGVSLRFEAEDGYSILHSAIEREYEDKHRVLKLLLDHGAELNILGINGWTPSHMAGCYNDLESLKLLREYGADLSMRTSIDDYATPLEEASKFGGGREVTEWLKQNTEPR